MPDSAARSLRILHVDSEMGFRGGQRQVELLMLGLRGHGHESTLVSPEGSRLAQTMEAHGFPVVGYRKPAVVGVHSPFLQHWLRRLAVDQKVDLVHAHSGNAHTLAVGAFLGNKPLISTRRVDFPIKTNFFSRRKYAASGQHFIAISNAIREILQSSGVNPDAISVVHSGVEVERVQGGAGARLREEWLGPEPGPLIGFVGALVDHKAPWLLAEALPAIRARHPGARVVFVGEGDARPRIEAVGAPGVVFAGWRKDVADCYAAFDLFVMPSRLEGLCTSLIDALAAGVPSVGSNVGGIPDVIEHEVSGLLFPSGDAAALARSCCRVLEDRDLARNLVAQGRLRVQQRFTSVAMVKGTMAVYDLLLSSPR
jgi:glycosyltransferase involved in cell wall biosynthesis